MDKFLQETIDKIIEAQSITTETIEILLKNQKLMGKTDSAIMDIVEILIKRMDELEDKCVGS